MGTKSSSLVILASVALLLIVGVSFGGFTKREPEVKLACARPDLSYEYNEKEKTAIFEGKEIPVPKLAKAPAKTAVLGTSNQERWVEIDLSEQKLRAWDGNNLYLETLVSTGLPWSPTPQGEFRIEYKSRAQKMEGGRGKYYYYLPNVPYVMFFGNASVPWSKGYSLHGTYWHNDFGRVHSHGCVNLPTPIAEKLYYWTSPEVLDGKNIVRAADDNQGTRVVIHN